eukprot:Plantae.Rhodophyta-Hildenbrandia_rubra.ctg4181.p1 GENE.Plantae.Rhodophyta-Hildenbrandia_rubra.ctg4181~~Plantae.Rhodophyta-Hildenbrandia_rubra.ctg4181.p1  ORF type:complete len:204 (+),score=25.49 Plantae.Rhodophyta-Hildenbrandia_rubra.ctg4181:224-835(+)
MARPVVAVDLDEVLGHFIPPLADFHNENYGTKLTVSDFHSYRFCEVWGGDDQGAIEIVHSFFDSKHFEDIPVVPGAVEGVNELKNRGYQLAVVTSRQHAIEKKTRDWVFRHFPNVFEALHFGNHWGLEGKKTSKPDLCKKIDATVLIDDSLQYAVQCANAGIRSLLFNLHDTYNWSRYTPPLSENISFVTNWKEILEHLPPVV